MGLPDVKPSVIAALDGAVSLAFSARPGAARTVMDVPGSTICGGWLLAAALELSSSHSARQGNSNGNTHQGAMFPKISSPADEAAPLARDQPRGGAQGFGEISNFIGQPASRSGGRLRSILDKGITASTEASSYGSG